MPERIDLVTHFFPPVGGPASNRLLGWARHFVSRGVRVRVTTPAPHPADPYFDEGCAVPPEVEVIRVAGLDLARHLRRAVRWRRLLVPLRDLLDWPDHRRIWNRAALASLGRLAPPPRVVITTSPYGSTHLIGLSLKQRLPGLFWVADIRDPWVRSRNQGVHTPLHRAYLLVLERTIARRADLIVLVHRNLVEDMAGRVGAAALRDKTLVVYHGVDGEAMAAFAARATAPPPGPAIVTFAGTIWEWNLPPGLFAGWARLRAAAGPGTELHFYGRIEPGALAVIDAARRAALAEVHVHGFRPRSEAIAALARSSALLVFNGPYRETVSSKLFDYIAAARPILYCGAPESAGAGILRDVGAPASVTTSYDDRGVVDLFDRFARALNAGDCGGFVPEHVPPELRSVAQAEKLLHRIVRETS